MTASGALRGRCKAFAVTFVALLAVLAFGAVPAVAGEFGLLRLGVSARNADGTPDLQAGSHPGVLVTTFVSNAQGDIKDARLELPPGFVGNPNAVPQCPYQVFVKREAEHPCSNETAVGFATTYVGDHEAGTNAFIQRPLRFIIWCRRQVMRLSSAISWPALRRCSSKRRCGRAPITVWMWARPISARRWSSRPARSGSGVFRPKRATMTFAERACVTRSALPNLMKLLILVCAKAKTKWKAPCITRAKNRQLLVCLNRGVYVRPRLPRGRCW